MIRPSQTVSKSTKRPNPRSETVSSGSPLLQRVLSIRLWDWPGLGDRVETTSMYSHCTRSEYLFIIRKLQHPLLHSMLPYQLLYGSYLVLWLSIQNTEWSIKRLYSVSLFKHLTLNKRTTDCYRASQKWLLTVAELQWLTSGIVPADCIIIVSFLSNPLILNTALVLVLLYAHSHL